MMHDTEIVVNGQILKAKAEYDVLNDDGKLVSRFYLEDGRVIEAVAQEGSAFN